MPAHKIKWYTWQQLHAIFVMTQYVMVCDYGPMPGYTIYARDH